MNVIFLTIFLSLILVLVFVFLFVYHTQKNGHRVGCERDALLPLEKELPSPDKAGKNA